MKAPAKTLAMIKLREPVKNSLFYLGEALVCDTVVELGGTKGTAVVLGDDFDKVSSMAVIDAAFNRQVSELDEDSAAAAVYAAAAGTGTGKRIVCQNDG